jgi:F0F1-type ATP synthase membrane subunit c/vacuolar-type H+-ATPase subunit K
VPSGFTQAGSAEASGAAAMAAAAAPARTTDVRDIFFIAMFIAMATAYPHRRDFQP